MKLKSFDKYVKIPLCILLSLLMLSSCGIIAINPPSFEDEEETTEAPETNPPYQVSEYEKYEANYSKEVAKFMHDVTDADYGGGSFLIATPKSALIVPDETVGAVLSKEMELRNAFIESELNIVVAEKKVDKNLMYDEIRQAIKSVSYYADLILINQSDIGKYAMGGAIANLSSLPGINLTADYYNYSSVEAGGGASKIYGVAGNASLDMDALSAVFYNKDLLAQITEENPYSLVDNGSWTWAKFLEYANGVSGLGDGYYSFGSQNAAMYLSDLIYISCGQKFVNVPQSAMPQIAFTADSAAPIIDTIKSVLNHEKRNDNSLEAISSFASGNTLFLIDKLSTMKSIANSKANWGVLPLPKYNAEQKEYKTLAYGEDAMFFAMVPTVSDTQKVSNVLAMLNIASYGDLPSAYAGDAMSYWLRDNASTRMVDKIMNSATYDFAYSYSNVKNSIASATFTAIRNPSIGVSSVANYLNSWTRRFNSDVYNMFKD